MSDRQNRFTMADLARLDEKMRTPPPPAMHYRPGGTRRTLGDMAGRDAVARQRTEVVLRLDRPEKAPAFEPGRDNTFTRKDLDRPR